MWGKVAKEWMKQLFRLKPAKAILLRLGPILSDIMKDRDIMVRVDLTRHDLPHLLKKNAIGVELGVATGHFSDVLLQSGKYSKLYSVDKWSDRGHDEEYGPCKELLSKYGDKSTILKMDFNEALGRFKSEYFDFIYIDAYAHTGQDNGSILHAWFPKLKKGGIFSGHDYDKAWPKTVEAVDAFCEQFNRKPVIINGHSSDQCIYRGWYFIK